MDISPQGPAPLPVDSPALARFFSNVRNVPYLLPFMQPAGETVGGLARRQGLTLNAAYRKVQQLHALGLLRVLSEEARSGRPVKRYGCVTRSFFVPAAQVSLMETLSESFGRYQAVMNAAFVRHAHAPPNPVGGLILFAEGGEVWLVPATPQGKPWRPDVPGTPAIHHASGALMLDYPDARALQSELVALFDRYREKRGTQRYLMHLMLTPLEGGGGLALPQAGYTTRTVPGA